jgi:signal transduction histidine kinase
MPQTGAPRHRFRPTLRTRLALWYGGLTLVAGVVLVTVTTAAAISAVSVSADSVKVVARIGDGTSSTWGQATDAPGSSATLPPGSTITVTGADGAGDSSTPLDGETVNSLIQKSVAAQNARIRDSVVRSVLWWSLAGLVLVVISAVTVGWVVGKRALEPLHRMTETVRRVAGDNLGERVALDGPDDEIKVLADTFDAMLERLDNSFDAQRNFVANASHELRTPLTISRTVLEVALADPETSPDLRQVGQSLLEVTERNERLIEGLLTLAAADREPQLTPGVSLTDIATVVSRGATTGAGPTVRADLGASPILIDGDEILLERLVQNLVDNARRYNVDDGFVTVTLRSTDDKATLIVENSGPQIPANEASTLFEPFRRLDRRGQREDRSAGYLKGGVGLGLSIVRSVAAAHHGSATAVPREDGGLVVTVCLPRRQGAQRAPSN